ncbi:DUF3313 family protein [Vibrio sp. D404a]|uniref:DUF3313 domain-containing protein n=1 Tax=unclassified Vibrio TaxID=2614977 RepID=UPI0025564C65|nr:MULTISPECIES: DUF3313 domain-containing protein [unclassified Vibrio]MDK9737294.1 DUF3313 family protein [Vibrio sp. D404a]MDK9798030.1 DUF3313 family protein [Vibrio sp. D449a]
MTFLKSFFLTTISVLLVGCAGGPIQKATKFTSYQDFSPGPDGGVDLVWARIGLRDIDRLKKKLANYDSVVIDQIFVLTEEGSIDSDDVQELTDHMLERLTQRISEHKTVVSEPNGRSLRFSIALSNVETPNPILAVTSSVLPFGLAMSTLSKVTTGEHTNVGSASVELLVSDAQDGTPLFAAIDRQAGNKDFSTMIDSLDDAKDAINYWVDRLGVTLTDTN